MKFLMQKIGLIARLSLTATALLFAQQSLAAGTDAGTNIQNLATVNYNVNGLAQTEIESAPGAGNSTPGATNGLSTDFLVDNRVDFTLIEAGVAGPTDVSPNGLNAVVEFSLTNTGNETQDYGLAASNIVGGAVNGLNDTFDMNSLRVYSESNGTAGWQADDRQDYADELVEGATVVVYIVADANVAALINGDGANVNMLATTRDGGAVNTQGAVTSATVGADTAAVDVVLAVGGVLNEGTANADDGYRVVSAALNITKTSSLISDPFNGIGADRKHIPGSVVRYVITVDNNNGGTQNATNIVLTDDLVEVTLAATISIDDGTNPVTTCTTTDADADGCGFTAGTLTIGVLGVRDITIVQGTVGTFTFDVTID